VLSVPLIGVTGVLAPALLLYGTERLGKAVRSPAKDTLLSHASAHTGRGSAFGVHQALDQTGAMLGPLLLAAVLGWRDGDYRLAFAVLAIPGVLVLALLFWLRHRVPDPVVYEHNEPPTPAGDGAAADKDEGVGPGGLPARFWQYAAAIAVLSCGIVSFPLLAYHAQTNGLLTDAQVPILFAVAMFVDGASGLVMGRIYDLRGPFTLLAVPVAAAASVLAFSQTVLWIWVGVAIWGVVNGVLDSTVKAVVTELVPSSSRAVAFGWLAFVRGAGLLIAGGLLGAAYDQSTSLAVGLVLAANLLALGGLAGILRTLDRRQR
jgi:MFS family permease